MRKEGNPFLDLIRARTDTEVTEVNKTNRDALPSILTSRIFRD
jgi:hypothetical protein